MRDEEEPSEVENSGLRKARGCAFALCTNFCSTCFWLLSPKALCNKDCWEGDKLENGVT